MAETLQDVMTAPPTSLPTNASVMDAARTMKDRDIGDVIVTDLGGVYGIVTDRDLVIRAIADGRDGSRTMLGDVCTRDPITMSPNDRIEDAVQVMRERALRRIPVTEGGRPVGVVSLGDLAVERDPASALAEISAAPPDQ